MKPFKGNIMLPQMVPCLVDSEPPHGLGFAVRGYRSGHTHMRTSYVCSFERTEDTRIVIETRNSVYNLYCSDSLEADNLIEQFTQRKNELVLQ
jgi:hypothetical protein